MHGQNDADKLATRNPSKTPKRHENKLTLAVYENQWFMLTLKSPLYSENFGFLIELVQVDSMGILCKSCSLVEELSKAFAGSPDEVEYRSFDFREAVLYLPYSEIQSLVGPLRRKEMRLSRNKKSATVPSVSDRVLARVDT